MSGWLTILRTAYWAKNSLIMRIKLKQIIWIMDRLRKWYNLNFYFKDNKGVLVVIAIFMMLAIMQWI